MAGKQRLLCARRRGPAQRKLLSGSGHTEQRPPPDSARQQLAADLNPTLEHLAFTRASLPLCRTSRNLPLASRQRGFSAELASCI